MKQSFLKRIRVLLFTDMRTLTGGNKRTIEVIRRAESHGIDYVPVMNVASLEQYKSLGRNLPGFSYAADLEKPKDGFHYLPHRIVRSSEELAGLARAEKAELVFSPHEFFHLELFAKLSASLSGLPWTLLLQLLPVVGVPRAPRKVSERLKLRAFTTLARATTLLAVSMPLAEFLRRFDPRVNLTVVDPGVGVDLDRIGSVKPADEHFDSVFFARMIPEKGIDDLLPVWRRVVQQRPNARLAVAGIATGEVEARFRTEVLKQGLERNVAYLGYLEENDLIALAKSSSVFVYPSHVDAFPLVVLEALACGTPVVAYATAAINSTYSGASGVFKVREGDIDQMASTVLALLGSNSLSSLSSSGIEFSKRYNWDNVVEGEKSAYLKVIEEWKA